MSLSVVDTLRHLFPRPRRRILNALVECPAGSVRLDECFDTTTSSALAERYTTHLDELERAALVEFDERRCTVSRGENFDQIVPVLQALSGHTDTERDSYTDTERERDKLELINRSLRHDLLNSLNTVRGRVSIVAESETAHSALDHYAVIERRLDEMIARVETMGAFTDAIVNGGMDELDNYELRDVLDEEVARVRGTHRYASVEQVDVPDVVVRADDRLSLVFENLLRNAVEHNDTVSPTVRVTGRCDREDVEIVIADDGPGIPERTKEVLFEEGVMGAESDGSGFGLHFVKRTIDDYDGDITIDGREPRGTAVTLRLQRGTAETAVSTSETAVSTSETAVSTSETAVSTSETTPD